jgi:molecular chaperone DnaK
VTFDIDANGILHVTAKDRATERSQHITITASSGLSESEVEGMRQDAETHAEDDRKRKELIEARNEADNAAYAADKALKEHADKLSPELKAEIEEKLADLRVRSQADDVPAIMDASRTLGEAIQKIGAAAYEQAGDPQGDSDRPRAPETGSEVVEGEVKD